MDKITLLFSLNLVFFIFEKNILNLLKQFSIETFIDRISFFSFFGNKTITTGEGGMVCFKKKKHYEIAKKLRDHGMNSKKRYWHDYIGYNYRMTNIQAAVGLAQMERLEFFIKQKKIMAKKYRFYLNKNKQIFFSKNFSKTESSYWLYYIKLKKKISHARDKIINILLKKGIEVRNCFYPIHLMNPYKKYHLKKIELDFLLKTFQFVICLKHPLNAPAIPLLF